MVYMGKQKFSMFWTKLEEEVVGKKKERQTDMDAKLVKSVLSEVLVKKGGEENVVSSMDSERWATGNKGAEATGAIAVPSTVWWVYWRMDALSHVISGCQFWFHALNHDQ